MLIVNKSKKKVPPDGVLVVAIENDISIEDAERDAIFVNESGQDEDLEAACSIQETVTAQGNSHLTFGYFEKAIVNFHQHLSRNLN